ncbi:MULTISPECIES: alanine racemase [unclassified Halomonas]|uniref:alanine racemase n=1 Tax=unclassified Halomonas TaxID=2609666 RepID=UPI002885291B|nr:MULTISPECIES: alanine racemase [unclassified Halomonas]MDT0500715.1 alanine racemase [Halomonas sp. PAR7]MDT0513095.1 alanine racemase [Halomonas sp. LES1]MDT0591494.1 alanine racemase [Halomonas sp. PAR8]
MARPLIAEIDLDALRHNYRLACECSPRSRSVAVIKADAYGHGAVACARALEGIAPAFAVACIEEAVRLREAGITVPIVLLEGIFSVDEMIQVDELGLWIAVHSDWQIDALLGQRLSRPVPVWLKVDSGMHRLGFSPERAQAAWQRLAAAPEQACDLHLMSHFATADLIDVGYFRRQLAQLEALAERLGAPLCLANSPATLAHPEAHGAWNRPGVMLYGSDPLEQPNALTSRLAPVMTLRSAIIAVRELPAGEPVGYGGRWVTPRPSRIGVVAAGYGDGYDRHAVDGTPVLVAGKRTAIAGKVSMDMLTVDITDIPEADIGSEVVLWGRAANGEVLSVDEVARHCDTISYTLLTGVLPRVPRRYHGAS